MHLTAPGACTLIGMAPPWKALTPPQSRHSLLPLPDVGSYYSYYLTQRILILMQLHLQGSAPGIWKNWGRSVVPKFLGVPASNFPISRVFARNSFFVSSSYSAYSWSLQKYFLGHTVGPASKSSLLFSRRINWRGCSNNCDPSPLPSQQADPIQPVTQGSEDMALALAVSQSIDSARSNVVNACVQNKSAAPSVDFSIRSAVRR